jgi:hypothetical protein
MIIHVLVVLRRTWSKYTVLAATKNQRQRAAASEGSRQLRRSSLSRALSWEAANHLPGCLLTVPMRAGRRHGTQLTAAAAGEGNFQQETLQYDGVQHK